MITFADLSFKIKGYGEISIRRRNLIVVYCVQRVKQDHYQKQVPYTLNKWFIALSGNNRSLFQEWFEVQISHLKHATTVYLLQECHLIVILEVVYLSHLQNLILSNVASSPLLFNPMFPICMIFHVFANPLLNVQYIFCSALYGCQHSRALDLHRLYFMIWSCSSFRWEMIPTSTLHLIYS